MTADNPLAREFIQTHPADAARIVERLPDSAAAELLTTLLPQHVDTLLAAILPRCAAAALRRLPDQDVAEVMGRIPVNVAARLLRAVDAARREKWLGALPDRARNRLERQLSFPAHTIGSIMQTEVFLLPLACSVSDALQRIGASPLAIGDAIVVIDDDHRFSGIVRVTDLVRAAPAASLRDYLDTAVPTLLVRSPVLDTVEHSLWNHYRVVPVVESDRSIMGVLDFADLKRALAEYPDAAPRVDAFTALISLFGLYWMTTAKLFDAMLSRASAKDVRK
jgi:magnesium transporter